MKNIGKILLTVIQLFLTIAKNAEAEKQREEHQHQHHPQKKRKRNSYRKNKR